MKYIRTLIVYFDTELKQKDIPLFRGGIIQSLEQKNILFHNHTEDGFRFSYPFIQYKSIRGKAAIVCVENGTEAIGEIFNNIHFSYNIRNKDYQVEISDIQAFQTTVGCEDTLFHYKLYRWLPLNSTNYAVYCSTESIASHIDLLEKVLVGNILSFLKGIDIHITEQIKVSITKLGKQRITKYKGVPFTCLDISFNTNIRLPHLIGLGKGASIGFGVLHINNKNQS